jgi:hypothetical protein
VAEAFRRESMTAPKFTLVAKSLGLCPGGGATQPLPTRGAGREARAAATRARGDSGPEAGTWKGRATRIRSGFPSCQPSAKACGLRRLAHRRFGRTGHRPFGDGLDLPIGQPPIALELGGPSGRPGLGEPGWHVTAPGYRRNQSCPLLDVGVFDQRQGGDRKRRRGTG